MANFVRLWEQRDSILDDFFEASKEAQVHRLTEYRAAICIQAIYRGYITRLRLEQLNRDVTLIQRYFRGFLGRKKFRARVVETLRDERAAHYGEKAILIQKTWRGYWSRKYVHNYYAVSEYLRVLRLKNAAVRRQLDEEEVKLSNEETKGTDQATLRMTARRERCPLPEVVLPPIPYKEPPPHVQGPFKTHREVMQLRYKPLRPSLRVETSFNSAYDAAVKAKQDEWVLRVTDKKFITSSHLYHPYVPSVHSKSEYGPIAYGTQTFRDSGNESYVGEKDFKTVVSPIPVFDACPQ